MKYRHVSQDYIDFVPESKALKRLKVLSEAFNNTLSALELGDKEKFVNLNLAIMSNSIYSYWYDIKRLRDFHGFDLINKPKKAAYHIKWIVKEKPIYFDPTPFGDDDILEFLSCVNEYFAVRVGAAYAGVPIELLENDLDGLVYELAFREPSTGMISLWFEQLMRQHGLDIE